MKPILYPQAFLEKKIQRKCEISETRSKFVCLMKYSPKYYKSLELHSETLSRSTQLRVKQLKIIKKVDCNRISCNDEKSLKKLFQGCRKTLKHMPSNDGWHNLHFCMNFPRVDTINLWSTRLYEFPNRSIDGNTWSRRILNNDYEGRELDSQFFWMHIKRSHGYFWSGHRFVENLEALCEYYSDLIIIKKLNDSGRFLSSLKVLKLTVNCSKTDLLIHLMKNTNFLRHVTYLRIESFELSTSQDLVQSIINCCLQCSFLSLREEQELPLGEFPQSLNLSSLHNLQGLEIAVANYWTCFKSIDFVPSIQEVRLTLFESEDNNSLGETFDFQDVDDRDQDKRVLERYKVLGSFFERWRKLSNLKVLHLKLWPFSKMNILMKNFIFPLLREKSQLETFKCEFGENYDLSPEDKLFDLDTFLKKSNV